MTTVSFEKTIGALNFQFEKPTPAGAGDGKPRVFRKIRAIVVTKDSRVAADGCVRAIEVIRLFLFLSVVIFEKRKENAVKMSRVVWMMFSIVSLIFSIRGIVAAQGRSSGPSGKPLTSVDHDASLTGDGTTAGPLGIATAGVTTDKIANGAVTASKTDGTIVTAVTASTPLVSSGGSTPNISLPGVIISTNNTGVGSGALTSNTTGNNNTASGGNALFSNTTGNGNTASGLEALHNNTTGNNNTASGGNALFNNTTGESNTASGFNALLFNSTGSYNTALGYNTNVSKKV